MRRITTKFFIALLAIFSLISGLNAQTTVLWPLSNTTAAPNNIAPTPASGTGFTATSQTQSVCNQLSWTGYGSDGQQTAQRVKTADATRSLPSAFATDTYVEYAITAAAGYNLSVSQIQMYLGGGGTTSIFAQIKYSTDDFVNSTTLDAGGTALVSNTASAITLKTFSSLTVAVNGGSTLKIRVYPKNTGTASTTKYLISNNVSVTFTSTLAITNPFIAKTSGSDPASVMETMAMTPVVYGYINVADAANVVSNWYTDNSYTTTTTAPSGISIATDGTAKTVTVSGTPAASTAGTYYYKITLNETGGNSVQGSVVVAPYVAPTPAITAPNANTQYVRAGENATAAFTITNGTGATVTGLPTGLSGNYSSGTYTISGTVNASVTPGDYVYTVKATPMAGYTGSDITFNDTIAVRNADAARVLYIAASTLTPSQDMLLRQFMSKLNYIVTKRAPINNPVPTDYSTCDLIVLHETLTGGDATTATNEVSSIKSVDKPILNTKSFFYTYSSTASSNRWGWGTPNSIGKPKGVKVIQPSHPIFNGVTITDSLYLYNTATFKNIQCTTADKIGGYNLAVGATGAAGVAIHELPGTIRLGAGKTSKYLLISLLTGAYNDLTADALKLLDNAAQYLMTGTQFTAPSLDIASFNVNSVSATIDNTAKTVYAEFPTSTDLSALQPTVTLTGVGTTISPASGAAVDFTNSYSTPVNYTVTDGINTKVYAVKVTVHGTGLAQNQIAGVTFDGQTIHNAANVGLQVYDATGRKVVSSTKDINMSANAKGIYFVKSNGGTLKIMLAK